MSRLLPYSPPSIGERIELDLSRNEGRPPSGSLIDFPDPAQLVGRYPDTTELRQALADLHGLPPDRVLVTAGADDALLRCFLARVGPGRDAVTTRPSFEMLPRYAAQAGGDLAEIPWWDGAFPTEDILSSLWHRSATLFVVSPNNPTGNVITSADLNRLADAAELVVLDGAYMEFTDTDLTPEALELDNVVVLRTLSKAWGLAGLRVGYLLGPAEVVAEISAFGNPYPVSGPSQAIARTQLESSREMESRVSSVKAERVELTRVLDDTGVTVLPSQANFVLAGFDNADWVLTAAASLGVGLRHFPGRPGLERYLRIGLPGSSGDFERLLGALLTILRPEALLFDLDGVLADVDGSQTTAIIQTAATFDVEIDRADIDRAKSAGGSNDDWALTWRLCRDRGAHVSLEEVTHRFEVLYQGEPGSPGLKLNERPLVTPSELASWASKYPIGVVTGRPRSDAEEFIEREGLGTSISALVTRDDAPLKPNPKPVRLALEQLGVDRAWMIGDTVDDVAAARGAGVLPIGVVSPGADPDTTKASLSSAAVVLDSTPELEEILP